MFFGKGSISGGLRARGQDRKAHDDAVLQCPVGSSRHGWWRTLVLQARAADGPAASWAGIGKGAAQLGEVPVVCV